MGFFLFLLWTWQSGSILERRKGKLELRFAEIQSPTFAPTRNLAGVGQAVDSAACKPKVGSGCVSAREKVVKHYILLLNPIDGSMRDCVSLAHQIGQ
jgi:hypothetical protein